MPGSRMSMEMTSGKMAAGEDRSRMRKASSALPTEPATSSRGSCPMMYSRNSRITLESSTIRTLIFFIKPRRTSKDLPDGSEQLRLIELPFHDISVGAQLQTPLLVFAPIECRYNHDRNPVQGWVLFHRFPHP